jgi:hypothetical protein
MSDAHFAQLLAIQITYQVAHAVLLLKPRRLSTLAYNPIRTMKPLSQSATLVKDHTSTGGSHKDDAHLLGDRLRLGFAAETALQLLHTVLKLLDHVLQTVDDLFCDGSHYDY